MDTRDAAGGKGNNEQTNKYRENTERGKETGSFENNRNIRKKQTQGSKTHVLKYPTISVSYTHRNKNAKFSICTGINENQLASFII